MLPPSYQEVVCLHGCHFFRKTILFHHSDSSSGGEICRRVALCSHFRSCLVFDVPVSVSNPNVPVSNPVEVLGTSEEIENGDEEVEISEEEARERRGNSRKEDIIY